MSLNIQSLELSINSAMWRPLPEVFNADSCNNAAGQRQNLPLTKEEQQVGETHREEQHTPKNPNQPLCSDASAVSPDNVSMPDEPTAKLPAATLQKLARAATDAAAVLSTSQDPPASHIALPEESIQSEPLPGSFTIATTNATHSRPPQAPYTSFLPMIESVPQNVLQQVHGADMPVMSAAASQAQTLPQSAQPVRDQYHAPIVPQSFPPFHGDHAAQLALSVLSTNETHAFKLTAPEEVRPPHSSQIPDAQIATDHILFSRENGVPAGKHPHCREQGRADVHVLARYNLEGFSHAKVWVHNLERCPHCHKDFASMSSLREHIKRTHRNTLHGLKKVVEKVKCPHCEALLMNKTNLRRHVEKVHSSGEAKFACELCPTFFSSHFSVITHRRDLHGIQPASRQRGNGVRKKTRIFFRCETCGYCSNVKSNVTRHVRSNHIQMRSLF